MVFERCAPRAPSGLWPGAARSGGTALFRIPPSRVFTAPLLPSMLKRFQGASLYVRVAPDQFRIRDLNQAREQVFPAPTPFTSTRLLIGGFQVAEALLREALGQMRGERLLAAAPRILMHPLTMTEGGLSEVEERVFRDVALAAGAAKVVVWVGPELDDQEVEAKLNAGPG